MHKPYKKITAQLLLFSFLLESCYNPNIGIGRQALPTPGPADKQRQYAGEPHDKYPPKPPSHILTTADNHPIAFTYHNGQWQAAIKEYAAHGSSQRRELPVVFEPGLTLEDVVDSNPTEQKQLLHLCASEEDPDQLGYVYVGKAPSQAKSHPQLLSRPAARQTTPPSAVGLAQQQATAQPQQARTSPQQAQEQPGRQALLALTGPVQEIGGGPRSQDQLPTTPARATSKPLPTPSSASPSQGVANTQPTSPQRGPSRRALSWRNQHELLHSQRAAQAKRAQSAAMAKPGNQLAQPAAPSQAIPSTTTHPPSLAHKAPPGIASQNLLAQGGQQVRFMHRDGQWKASVRERIGLFSRVWVLPVACQGHGDVAKALAELQEKPTQYTQRRIHVMYTKQPPYGPQFVYLGAQGLQGGGNGAPETSGNGDPKEDLPTVGDESAQGGEPSQSLVASQGPEASGVALQARMAQGDITSTQGLVEALNAAQPAEQPALQQWIQRYIAWFNEECVKSLPKEEEIQEYRSLAHIQTDKPAKRKLLASYFNSLCRQIGVKYGKEPLIEALEYTLQNIDSQVFGTNPAPLIQLGDDLLAKLDAGKNAFIKETYPTDRSTLYALHQALVLIQQIAPGRLNPNQENGLYSRFKTKIEALSKNTEYYPIRYHARLLEQSLPRLQRPASSQERLQGGLRRVGHGLEGIVYLYQGACAVAKLDFDLDAFKSGYKSLQEAFASKSITAEDWYDWHQAMNQASLLSLEDASKYADFKQGLQKARSKIKQAPKEGREALRFGAVMQLRMLSLNGPTPDIREASTNKLVELAQVKEWGGKTNVMEGLLDGLAEIAVQSQGAEKGQAQAALESLRDRPAVDWVWHPRTARREAAAQAAIKQWLGEQTLADKLSAIKSAPSATPTAGGLFRVIHNALSAEAPAGTDPADAQKARQALKEHYQHQDFAQVRSLFEGEAPKHVDSLECQLMLTEQVQKQTDREGPQDDVSTHHERLEWVKKPIALEDLFKKRKTKPDGPEKEIQKVLLVGEPGTGKTTLSRRLAYRWTQGKWGEAFEAVYVLPVRALQKDRYDDNGLFRRETLATAIANNCFLPREEDNYKCLRRHISEELEKPTTLVVLDGLDERYGASEALLSQAKAGTHKLLMLSRPYGIEQERTLADIEIEHAGFSDAQMEDYVRGDLSPELGEGLLGFIRAYPSIAAIAHVPVNLQILCALWQDNRASVREEMRNGSLPGLYRRLTEYIWERYARKWPLHNEDGEELFDTLGKIALDVLQKGEVLISPDLVQDHVKKLCLKNKLKDSGLLLLKKDSSSLLLQSVGMQYQFPHLTFQEYFAGRTLSRQLLSSDGQVRKKAEKFFTKHQYEPQYGQMLSFLSGEASKLEEVDGTRQLLSLLQEAPQEVVGVQHMLLQMRLLNEWLCVAGEDLEEELAALEEEFHVCRSLVDWFGEGMEWVRRKGDSKLLELLTTGLQGSRAVAAHAPALVELLLEALRDKNDPYGSVRSAASSPLVQFVAAAPDHAEQVLESLQEAMRDKDSGVRSAASQALGKVAAAAPDHAEQVLESLQEAMRDSDEYVRRAASSPLVQFVTTAPDHAKQVLESLQEAMRDSDEYVRRAASPALVQFVAAAPDHAEQVLESLQEAMRDKSEDVRRTASSPLCSSSRLPLITPSKYLRACKRPCGIQMNMFVVLPAPPLCSSSPLPLTTPSKYLRACKRPCGIQMRMFGVLSARPSERSSPLPLITPSKYLRACKRPCGIKILGFGVLPARPSERSPPLPLITPSKYLRACKRPCGMIIG